MNEVQTVPSNTAGNGRLSAHHIERRVLAYLERSDNRPEEGAGNLPDPVMVHAASAELIRALEEQRELADEIAAVSASRGQLIRALLDQTSAQAEQSKELRETLAGRDQVIAELQARLEEGNRTNAELREALAQSDQAITELRSVLEEGNQASAELREALAGRDQVITELREAVETRNRAIADTAAEIGAVKEAISLLTKPVTVPVQQPPVITLPEGVASAEPQSNGIPLRIAIMPTPRSGSVWLRTVLSHIYGVPSFSAHTPSEIDWAGLPTECVFAMHWHRTPMFLAQLESHGFRTLSLARHPLDVLISILQFALRDASTERWLEGEGGNERSIYGAMPRSAAFLEYARGARAKALLSVTPEWWKAPGSYHLRYEDLVANTHATLEGLTAEIGVDPRKPISSAIEATSIPRLRASMRATHHFWQGMPGLWRMILTPTEATCIAEPHLPIVKELGYTIDPDPNLDGRQADAHWIQLIGQELAADLRSLPPMRHAANVAQARIGEITAKLAEHERTLGG